MLISLSSTAAQRQELAKQAMGFGRHAAGGNGGPIVVVNSTADGAPARGPAPAGSLRWAVTAHRGPVWVIFDLPRPSTIMLGADLLLGPEQAYTTLDGRGADVTIAGHGIVGNRTHHIILTHLALRDAALDLVSFYESQHVWINQLTLSSRAFYPPTVLNQPDGMIDITMGSTDVTISGCHMSFHDKVVLLGGDDADTRDKGMRVTLYRNFFGAHLMQRLPRCRYGAVHVAHNVYTSWDSALWTGSCNCSMLAEGNFVAEACEASRDGKVPLRPPGAGRQKYFVRVYDDTASIWVRDNVLPQGVVQQLRGARSGEPSLALPYHLPPFPASATERLKLREEIAMGAGHLPWHERPPERRYTSVCPSAGTGGAAVPPLANKAPRGCDRVSDATVYVVLSAMTAQNTSKDPLEVGLLHWRCGGAALQRWRARHSMQSTNITHVAAAAAAAAGRSVLTTTRGRAVAAGEAAALPSGAARAAATNSAADTNSEKGVLDAATYRRMVTALQKSYVNRLAALMVSALRAARRPGNLRFIVLVQAAHMAQGLCEDLSAALWAAEGRCAGAASPAATKSSGTAVQRLCPLTSKTFALPLQYRARRTSLNHTHWPDCKTQKWASSDPEVPFCSCNSAQVTIMPLDRAPQAATAALDRQVNMARQLHVQRVLELATHGNFARNVLHEMLLPLGLRRVIYLDTDVVVQRDLAELWAVHPLPPGRCVAMAGCTPGLGTRLQMWLNVNSPVIRRIVNTRPELAKMGCMPNAGVLAIDLERYASMGVTGQIEQLLELSAGQPKSGMLWRQGVQQTPFLLSTWDKMVLVDKRWNKRHLATIGIKIKAKQLDDAYALHWSGRCKPWLPRPAGYHTKRWLRYLTCDK